jgi:thymidylate synthase ThyX
MKLMLVEKNQAELDQLDAFLSKNQINKSTFFEIAKTINFSFSVENCSRLMSHHICESLDSYTQQSQRYVKMGDDSYIVPEEIIGTEIEKTYKTLMKEVFDFYREMTKLKEGFAGRKASEADYVNGIKIEDGRYILPLATTTNILVTMNFSNITRFFNAMKRLKNKESEFLLKEIKKEIGKENIIKALDDFSNEEVQENLILDFTKQIFDKVDSEHNVFFINSFELPIKRSALGALTSTNSIPPSEIQAKWEEENKVVENSIGVTERVVGYGHNSIIEHSRTNFGMIMSLTCYHQFERHRLPSNIRENYDLIPVERKVIIPPSVEKNSEITEMFNTLVKKIKSFRNELKQNQFENIQNYLLLNCDLIKVISSTNARMDNEILAERTCNNAQWEIRNLYNKKLVLLKKLGPVLYDRAGPPCTKGVCPEGALSCGKIIEMREKYGYFGK